MALRFAPHEPLEPPKIHQDQPKPPPPPPPRVKWSRVLKPWSPYCWVYYIDDLCSAVATITNQRQATATSEKKYKRKQNTVGKHLRTFSLSARRASGKTWETSDMNAERWRKIYFEADLTCSQAN